MALRSPKRIKQAAAAKGLAQEALPTRHALSDITKGDAIQRSLGNYAKLTPTLPDNSPGIVTPRGKTRRLV